MLCTDVCDMCSLLFMRFSLAIKPQNYILFACHAANETVQLNQLRRWYEWHSQQPPPAPEVELAKVCICRLQIHTLSWPCGCHLICCWP